MSLPYPEPYRSLQHLMPFKLEGWFPDGNKLNLEKLIDRYHVKTIIEVGSWVGVSTIHLASHLPEGGRLYAVDTWKGSENEQYPADVLATLYDQFLSNMIHVHLIDRVFPVRMESFFAAQELKEKVRPDLVFIDATHTYEAVKQDLEVWYPYVQGHGVICGDDFTWRERIDVGAAVLEFALGRNLALYQNGKFWWLEEETLCKQLGPMNWTIY